MTDDMHDCVLQVRATMDRSFGSWELSGVRARLRAFQALLNTCRQILKSRTAMPHCALCECRLAALWGGRKIQALLIDKCFDHVYIEGVCVKCLPNLADRGHKLPLPLMNCDRLNGQLLQLAVDMQNFGWSLPNLDDLREAGLIRPKDG
jgi:hypothetical protein